MKRSWLGLGLLIVLLAASVMTTWIMTQLHESIEEDLKQAAAYAVSGDWNNADRYFRRAKEDWDQWNHLRSCFADHTPVEEIDSGLALLEVYCVAREDAAFAAECCRLARQVAAVGEAHELVWWNVL